MNTRESFTVDEILELLREIDVDASIGSDHDDEDGFVVIECFSGPIEFFCNLYQTGPFYERLALTAFRFDVENVLTFTNSYNGYVRISQVAPTLDDDSQPIVDEDGQTPLHAKLWIHFAGGVTTSHIRYLFELWIEELVDFYELQLDDDDDDLKPESEVGLEVPQSPEFLELPLVERIAVYLSLNSERTAREMSKILGFDRHEINQILYKHRDRFSKGKSQPPRWSTIN